MRSVVGVILASLVLVTITSSHSEAAIDGVGKTKAALAVRTMTPPVIDGRLDEPAWEDAPPDDRFTQFFPEEGKPPTEKTEVRVLYDDQALYVGVRMFDSLPEGIVARLTRRDRDVESDWVAIAIDSQHDHHSGYAFFLNAAGVQTDLLLFDDTNANVEWDAVWDGAVARDERGWTAELEIPLSVLRFSAGRQKEWGFQVSRYISRKKELIAWTFVPSSVQGLVSRFGHLTGFEGLRPGRTLEIRPFATSEVHTHTDSRGAFLGLQRGSSIDASVSGGVDLKLGLASNLTLDATINPDFGQVEADQVVLNLSRYEVFFPEKRAFFLEGGDVFQTPIQLFYSRRIGRPPTSASSGDYVVGSGERLVRVTSAPTVLPIWTAAKLNGQASHLWSVGALVAITGQETVATIDDAGIVGERDLAPVRSYSVLRGRYSLGGASYVGMLGTAVHRLGGDLYRADANHDAYTGGVDAQWQSESGQWRITTQAVLSERVGGPSRQTSSGTPCAESGTDCAPITRTDGTRLAPGSVGYAGTVQLNQVAEHSVVSASYSLFSPRLDVNDVGFANDFNKHDLKVAAGYAHRKPSGAFQSFAILGVGSAAMNFDGVPLNLGAGGRFEAQFRSYVSLAPELGFVFPGTWDTNETLDGARFQRLPGTSASISAATDSRKRLVFSGRTFGFLALGGGSYDGALQGNVAINASDNLELDISPEIGWSANAVRFYDCANDAGASCTVDTEERHYRFADLDSGFLSFTARGTYTFSPRLSLQAYTQLFMAQGSFSDYRSVDTLGPYPDIRRDDLLPTSFNGDIDGDGKKDDDFQETSLHVNVVLRWEFVPGSTLFGVYTRTQNAAFDLAGGPPRFRVTGLSTGPTEEVLLIKLVYFWA